MTQLTATIAALLLATSSCTTSAKTVRGERGGANAAPATAHQHQQPDSTATAEPEAGVVRLTEDDYIEVARELGVEVAAIKAVVDIEAGATHEGFAAPGQPLINFDISMFNQFARRNGINLAKYRKTHPTVFAAPNTRKYGSRQNAQYARLKAARTIDNRTAIEGTFWGMFQIGGFNWKKCGAASIDDFVERMSRSEREQLELFAGFLKSTGLDKHLRAKNWAAFARGYNGPSYASRGYHTRMANAYAKHKRAENSKKENDKS